MTWLQFWLPTAAIGDAPHPAKFRESTHFVFIIIFCLLAGFYCSPLAQSYLKGPLGL